MKNHMSKSRFNISNIKIMTSSRFNIPFSDECSICRCNVNEDSPQFKSRGLTSTVIIGECGHAFHEECINGWLKINSICPFCSEKWVTKKK